MKDIHTWNELAAEVARLERENQRLRGSRSGCEMCNTQDCRFYILITLKETNSTDNYCPFCGRKLEADKSIKTSAPNEPITT